MDRCPKDKGGYERDKVPRKEYGEISLSIKRRLSDNG
jgi:hypothetical protein